MLQIGIFGNKSSVWQRSWEFATKENVHRSVVSKSGQLFGSHYTSVWNVHNARSFCMQKAAELSCLTFLSDCLGQLVDTVHIAVFRSEAAAFVCSGTGMYPTACFCTAIFQSVYALASFSPRVIRKLRQFRAAFVFGLL